MVKRLVERLSAVLLLSASASAAGQSLVATTKNPLKVAASYGYSQVHHAGEWIRVDVVVQSERAGTLRLHKAFSLLTPDGERIALPSQREYRAGFAEIQAMRTRAANMNLSPCLAHPGCVPRFGSWVDMFGESKGRYGGRPWRLWGNGDIDWTATVGPAADLAASTPLYFHSSDGWPAGEYWLEVDGPGDLEAQLPVRLH